MKRRTRRAYRDAAIVMCNSNKKFWKQKYHIDRAIYYQDINIKQSLIELAIKNAKKAQTAAKSAEEASKYNEIIKKGEEALNGGGLSLSLLIRAIRESLSKIPEFFRGIFRKIADGLARVKENIVNKFKEMKEAKRAAKDLKNAEMNAGANI